MKPASKVVNFGIGILIACIGVLIDWRTTGYLGSFSLKLCEESERSWRDISCRSAIVLSKEQTTALIAAAAYEVDQERSLDALGLLSRAELQSKQDANFYFVRAKALDGLKRSDEAIGDYSASISLDPTDPASHNNRGTVYLAENKLDAAILDFEKAHELDPESSVPLFNLGLAFFDSDNLTALKYFTDALEREKDAKTYSWLAKTLYFLDREKDAVEAITNAIKLEPNSAHLYNSRGIYLCYIEKTDSALNDFNLAIEREPDNPEFLYERSLCLKKTGDLRAALADVSNAIKFSGTDSSYFFQRGLILHDLRQREAAIEDYSKVIQLEPNADGAYFNRAQNRYHLNDFHGAKEDLDRFVKMSPNDPDGYWLRKNVSEQLGDSSGARQDADKALELFLTKIKKNPADIQTYLNRAFLLQELDLHKKAEADLSKALEIDKDSRDAQKSMGWFLITMERYKEAIDHYNSAIVLDELDAEAFNERGMAKFYLKDYTGSIEDLSEAISLEKDEPQYLANRAEAYEAIDRLSRAIVDMNRALELDSSDAEKFLYRGDLWRASGNNRKALSDYTEALERDSKSVSSYYKRGITFIELGKLDEAESDLRLVLSLEPQYANALEQLKIISQKRSVKSRLETTASRTDQSRVALVIGNSRYLYAPHLKNTVSDAILVSKKLTEVGFNVTTVVDGSRREIVAALSEFQNEARQADWALVYFAGHGVEIEGVNYMIPTDGNLKSEQQAARDTVPLEAFVASVEAARLLRMVIVDACRENPFSKPLGASGLSRNLIPKGTKDKGNVDLVSSVSSPAPKRIDDRARVGLARVEPDPGTLVVFAAKSGQVALDGVGRNSPFATALVKRINEAPPREVRRIFEFVREDVVAATEGVQQPFAYGSLAAAEDFFFTNPN